MGSSSLMNTFSERAVSRTTYKFAIDLPKHACTKSYEWPDLTWVNLMDGIDDTSVLSNDLEKHNLLEYPLATNWNRLIYLGLLSCAANPAHTSFVGSTREAAGGVAYAAARSCRRMGSTLPQTKTIIAKRMV